MLVVVEADLRRHSFFVSFRGVPVVFHRTTRSVVWTPVPCTGESAAPFVFRVPHPSPLSRRVGIQATLHRASAPFCQGMASAVPQNMHQGTLPIRAFFARCTRGSPAGAPSFAAVAKGGDATLCCHSKRVPMRLSSGRRGTCCFFVLPPHRTSAAYSCRAIHSENPPAETLPIRALFARCTLIHPPPPRCQPVQSGAAYSSAVSSFFRLASEDFSSYHPASP